VNTVQHKAYKLVVIGGGAAGFFCAVNAARHLPQGQVLLLEKSGKLLSKVKVSGGGRCNVTHHCFQISELVKKYPRGASFLKKAFHQFQPADTIEWFQSRGVPLKAEPDGRMFPVTDDSETIMQCLLQEADRYAVNIQLRTEVTSVQATPQAAHRFELTVADGRKITADAVCVTTGGFPKNEQWNWLRATGHTVEAPLPSLFTFNIPQSPLQSLMGIALEKAQVRIKGMKAAEEGPLLITHWGLSGPAVLRLSAWYARELAALQYRFPILVNWLPGENETGLQPAFARYRKELAGQKMKNRNPFQLPQRLWEKLVELAGIDPEIRWADLPAKLQQVLIRLLCSMELTVQGKTTFKEEFVTAGGICLPEIDPQTMQSRLIPGLYFAGEVMDVDGITGGFNFQHAWTSGFIAAASIAAHFNEPKS
jgi:predicted Rossmann fold flavoprotein